MAHYYELVNDNVIPRHYIEMSSRPGELRPTRITDVKKWWKEGKKIEPSVTNIQGILAKPQLTNWIIDQHLEQAYSLNPADYQSLDLWLDACHYKADTQMDKAPSAGSDLHKCMDDYDNRRLGNDHPMFALCQKVHNEIASRLDDLDAAYTTEQNFVSELGYGGQVDLHIYTGNDVHLINDYKTKLTKDKFKPGKMAYMEHYVQLAAYRKGLGLDKARCANIFVCLEDGQIDFHEHKEEDLIKGWEIFKKCLEIWNLINR